MAINYDISYINSEFSRDAAGFIAACEREFHDRVTEAALNAKAAGARIVMLAGPSSSGKTTTASIIDETLEREGGRAYVVSLDDFYLNRGEGPKLPDGSDDYESVWALDVPLIGDSLSRLIRNGRAALPLFDFTTGTRRAERMQIRLKKNDMLIIEGLHALNPVITDGLPPEDLALLYISVSSRIVAENNIYLNKRDLRFVRRMIRDYRFRASSPEHTFRLWRNVLTGEDMYLFPYEDRAQFRINSLHPYEPCVFAPKAISLLQTVPEGSPFRKNALLLAEKLSGFARADSAVVPENSLLQEFLGEAARPAPNA